MVDEYRLFLENLSSFSTLMKATRRMNESVRRTSRTNFTSHPDPVVMPTTPPQKRPIVATVKNGQRPRPFNRKKPAGKPEFKPDQKQERKAFNGLRPFCCGVKKAVVLLKQWVKDIVVQLLFVDQLPSQADDKDSKYYPCHSKKRAYFEACVTLCKILDIKLQEGKLYS